MIINFLKTYWPDIVVTLIFIVTMLILIKKDKSDVVRKVVYGFVVQAEKEFGSKTGEVKYAHVVSQLYTRLPFILRLVFSQQDINKYIEDGVKMLKDSLNDGRFNLLSYDIEKQDFIK